MATCRDPEGWRAISRIRDFDTTLCFEEGIILSVLLGGLLVAATWRSLQLCLLPSRTLTSKSRWLLRSKIVGVSRAISPNLC
jgi:ATP-binding cassette subfamily C (CFTR/MRP) protein 1